ncbi:phosphoadenosine phosphosulfate reductase family protein [Antarcticibacterium arcticum]|uniref:Phosphoadenosine phosphosulfate reductase family protein n=1 Tax=Antarcticibacterium arcticum TaxID=2585771 RepID=A0A5B8YLM9_9FLAO|nr:phosphoadenosine phosphosulfate reductase family protein [Antarcticibacterium arcticum]QED38634.1 phosphoadenosine phosphosulfate reductase family protein [Antarcticibacterium arcticum]
MNKPRHVLGISGGKDSAALAIYLNDKYPTLNFEYYFCDTGKELDETYQLIENLESYLGKKILKLENDELKGSKESPFDFYFKSFRGYLPSPQARWCTAMMKIKPFEKFVSGKPTISYVGIRGDEEREGYISREANIQSIFPFRRNIWSNDVLTEFFTPGNQSKVQEFLTTYHRGNDLDRFIAILNEPIDFERNNKTETEKVLKRKLHGSLDLGIPEFNRTVFDFLKTTEYPLATEVDFELLDNEDILVREDIFRILRESGIGVPKYYEKVEFEVDGQKGEYARSRSGCFFCFFQQKIEWIWLYEQHPNLYKEAMEYENEEENFTWTPNESLAELIQPARIKQIKLGHIQRSSKEESKKSPYLLDILEGTERDGCNTCFL